MRKAVVLGCDNNGLGVIRALAKSGIKVMSVGRSFGRFSRFVSKKNVFEAPLTGSSQLLDILLNMNDAWHGALLIPTTDPYVIFVANNREALSARYVTTVQDSDVILSILNKDSLYRQAKKIGIPIPKVHYIDSIEHLMHKQIDLSYPCILKPCESHKCRSIFQRKLFIINSFTELIERFNETQIHNVKVMVAEIIPGADDCLFHYRSYIDGKDNILAELCTQKIRQEPSGFGVAQLSKTVPMIQEIKQLTVKLLKSFSYHGVSSAEFKYDHRDNQFKLMEINVRPVLPEQLFSAAGVNFSYITYLDLVEGVKKYTRTYQHEIYWIDNFKDILEFFIWRKSKNLQFKDYFRPYLKKKVFCVPFFDDPLPFVFRSWMSLRYITKRLYNKLRKKLIK
jgi:predicted ATP-grasp superfamily ATP-dependent carboligase